MAGGRAVSIALLAALILVGIALMAGGNGAVAGVGRVTPTPGSWRDGLEPITRENVERLAPLVTYGNGRIETLDWSPDGSTLVVGASIGVWVLDADDLSAPPRLLNQQPEFVMGAAFNADGSLFVSANASGMVYLWDTATWTPRLTLRASPSPGILWAGYILHVGFDSITGDLRLISRTRTGVLTTWVWDTETGETLLAVDREIGVFGVFSPDGRMVASDGVISGYGTIPIWDLQTGEKQTSLVMQEYVRPAADTGVAEMAFSPDNSMLALGRFDSESLWIWNLNAEQDLYIPKAHEQGISAVAFSPDSTILASSGTDHTLRLWDSQTGTNVAILENTSPAMLMIFSSDGTMLAALGEDRVLELLEVEALLNRTTRLSYDHNHVHLPGHNGGPGVAFLDTDSGRLLSYDGEAVYSWNLEGNPEQETIFQLNHSGFDVIVGIDFSDDGRFAVLAYGPWASRAEANGKIALLEMENHTPPVTLYDKCDLYFFGWDNVVAISPDNRLVAASCRSERAIHLWDLATGEERLILWDQDIHSIHHLFFSTDNTLLATANRNDREGWVWNTETGAFWPQASLDLFYMGPVSYRAAEGWLTYGVDGAIRLLDLSAGKEISFQNVPEFKGLLPEPAISPDGQLLAAGFDDGIRLWDTQTRANVGFLNSVIVDSVAFSTDGRVLASGNLDGTITLWGVREEAP